MKDSVLLFPVVLHNIEGPSVYPAQVPNISPGEAQIPVSFATERNCEALAFPKNFPYGRFCFRDIAREVL